MLPTHGRYKFSAITQRPDYRWPGDKRLAVYIALNVEQFSFGQGKGSQIAPSDQAASQSVYSWRDYGNRVGFWRLLELFDALELPIQAQMNSAIYDHCPEIADALRRRGDEILGHGLTNSEEQGLLEESLETALIQKATQAIARHEGKDPTGWMSPWLSESLVTLDLLKEAGYRRPRIKILPTLHLGMEAERSRPYSQAERISEEMMEGYDSSQLLCSRSRTVTDRGVAVCPLLIEAPDAHLGESLEEASGPYRLDQGACYTCYVHGAICSNIGGWGVE